MNPYRRGTILGLTVAETFILLFFLLLFALFGFIYQDNLPPEREPEDPGSGPAVWDIPNQIETLTSRAAAARSAQEEALRARDATESERDRALEELKDAHMTEQAATQAHDSAEYERDQAVEELREARMAEEAAIRARDAAERERDRLLLSLSKGKNPPCWYKVVADRGGTREMPLYVFNVAIFEDGIVPGRREAPPGGAFDDGGGLYSEEWERLDIGGLPYEKKLSVTESSGMRFTILSVQGKSQVRTYECVFGVKVWDKTPPHAKKRWKAAHDRVIAGN